MRRRRDLSTVTGREVEGVKLRRIIVTDVSGGGTEIR
jgi:hypothetical protein